MNYEIVDPEWFRDGFEWDAGNESKNLSKHDVAAIECEDVLTNRKLIAYQDVEHSSEEPRYFVVGTTKQGRNLFIVFTRRGNRLRVISARDIREREMRRYASKEEDSEI